MKNITEILTAIVLFAFALGLIAFMLTVGTLLAPIAIFILSIVMIVLVMRELNKHEKKNRRRK